MEIMFNKVVIWTFLIVGSLFAGVYLSKLSNNQDPKNLITSNLSNHEKRREVLLYVGNEPLKWSDIDWEYNFYKANIQKRHEDFEDDEDKEVYPENESKLASLKQQITANLVERKLLYHYIQLDKTFQFDAPSRYSACIDTWQVISKNVTDQEGKELLKSQICEKSIIDQYITEVLHQNIKVEEHRIKDYYEKNIKEFSLPDRVLIRQVVLGSEREAKNIRYKINSQNFEYYAKNHSIAPESESGGLLGPFSRGQMPRIFDIAFTMKVGQIRSILKSTYGFHIIRLEKKYPKKQLTLDESREKIVKILTQEQREKEFQKWIELALSAIKVTAMKAP